MAGKEAFEKELRAQLDEWTDIVGRLRAKAESEHGEMRMNLVAEVERLAAYQKRAETYLRELREAQGDAWADLKSAIELARGEMRQALDRAWKRIEITPATAASSASEEPVDPEALPQRSL